MLFFILKNSLGNIGYHGPCAPRESGTHRYIIKLYGLKKLIPINENLSIKSSNEFEKKFEKYISEYYEKIYYYKHGGNLSNVE